MNVPSPLFTMKWLETLAPPMLSTHRSMSPSPSISPDVADFEMEVGGSGRGSAVSGKPQGVLAPDCVRQRLRRAQPSVRPAQEQLRRIAYSDTLADDVNAGVEDREIDPAVAVEVVRDHDRKATSIVPSTSSGACLKLPSPTLTNRRSGDFVNRSSRALYIPGTQTRGHRPAVAVEIRDGDNVIEHAETGLRDDARRDTCPSTVAAIKSNPPAATTFLM